MPDEDQPGALLVWEHVKLHIGPAGAAEIVRENHSGEASKNSTEVMIEIPHRADSTLFHDFTQNKLAEFQPKQPHDSDSPPIGD